MLFLGVINVYAPLDHSVLCVYSIKQRRSRSAVDFDQCLRGLVWPAGLWSLYVSAQYDEPLPYATESNYIQVVYGTGSTLGQSREYAV